MRWIDINFCEKWYLWPEGHMHSQGQTKSRAWEVGHGGSDIQLQKVIHYVFVIYFWFESHMILVLKFEGYSLGFCVPKLFELSRKRYVRLEPNKQQSVEWHPSWPASWQENDAPWGYSCLVKLSSHLGVKVLFLLLQLRKENSSYRR